MKRIINFVILLTIVCAIHGCGEDASEQVKDKLDKDTVIVSEAELTVLDVSLRKTIKLSPEEAIERALSTFDNVGNKNFIVRSVANCTPCIIDKKSRHLKSMQDSNMIDTLAYIVNFADSMGFAIVSADARVPDEIYAYGEMGNIEDVTENPGIKLFMANMQEYALKAIDEYEASRDSLMSSLADKLGMNINVASNKRLPINSDKDPAVEDDYIVNITKGEWETISKVNPLSVVEWGQGAPFNMYTPLCSSCKKKAQHTGRMCSSCHRADYGILEISTRDRQV